MKDKKHNKPKAEVTSTEIVPVKVDIEKGTALIEPQFNVERHGKPLCQANSFADLHSALYQAEELEETVVSVRFRLDGYPLDGIVAINRALDSVYGYAQAHGEWTWFEGYIPPQRVNIDIGFGRSDTFAYGKLNPPAWEDGWVQMMVDQSNPMSLMIRGDLKRKFEPAIKGIVELAKKFMKEKGLYRGNALEVDLDYIDKVEADEGFDPNSCAPKFIDISQEVTLILPRDIEFELENDIWGVIENPSAYEANGVPTKIGVLLSGPPGCGKTLTAAVTARRAAKHGYSYFYLKTPKRFKEAYEMASLNAPAVLFIEDIDQIFGGKRTPEMNSYLETMDGINTKHNRIITVFTTNYPERINEAFMRRGRLDNHIQLRALDAEAAGRFIKTFCGHELDAEVNYDAVGHAFRDLVPSDIRGGVYKAKKQAIKRFGEDIQGKITTDMLIDAGDVMRRLTGKGQGDGLSEAERELHTIREGERLKGAGNGLVAAKK